MRVRHFSRFAIVFVVACGGASPPDAQVAITVNALDGAPGARLDPIEGATWRVTVANHGGERVWSGELTSAAYGDGRGSIAYVGPCDADDNDNVVRLELLELRAGGRVLVDGEDFANPAPDGEPLTRTVACAPNADAAVVFDVTLMRNARQGFFDVAVDFDDVFCSAKVDCDHALLFDPLSGQRGRTVVLGFACTAGPDEATVLHHDDVVLKCDGLAEPIAIDVTAAPGQLDPPYPGPRPNTTHPLFQAAIYRDEESLGDAQGFTKGFWNVALGINQDALAAAGTCILTSSASVSAEAWDDGAAPDDRRWPVVVWDVTVASGGAVVCGASGLDDGAAVATAYETGHVFQGSWAPGDEDAVRHGGDGGDGGYTFEPGDGLGGGGRFAFAAMTPSGGRDLWLSDCTIAGTQAFDINPNGPTPFDMEGCMRDWGEFEPWRCEEFAQECEWQPDRWPYCGRAGGSQPADFVRFAGHVYFTADDGEHGRELWRTDGTTVEMVEDLAPGGSAFAVRFPLPDVFARGPFAVVGERLYFFANDGDHGTELFVTDGAVGPGAISLAADLNPGGGSSDPDGWAVAGRTRALFRAEGGGKRYVLVDAATGVNEVTFAGGRPPFDRLEAPLAVGGRLFFNTWGQGGADPFRLWVIDPGATVARQLAFDVGAGCGGHLGGADYLVCPFPGFSDQDQSWCRVEADGLVPVATADDLFFRECAPPQTIGGKLFFVARYMDIDRHRVSWFDGVSTTRSDVDSYFAAAGTGGYLAQTGGGLARVDAGTLAFTALYEGQAPDAFADVPSLGQVVLPVDAGGRQLGCVDVSDPVAPSLETIPLYDGDADPRGFTELPAAAALPL